MNLSPLRAARARPDNIGHEQNQGGSIRMLTMSLIGAALVVITTIIHAYGTTRWMRFVVDRFTTEDGTWLPRDALKILLSTALVLLALHTIEIIVWAVAYRGIVPDELQTFEQATYFSFVTFTTLGYGDITLTEVVRLLSGIEALNGIFLVGWTTAMLFSMVQRVWQYGNRKWAK